MSGLDGRVYKVDLDRASDLGDGLPEVLGFAEISRDPFETQGAEGRGQQQVRSKRKCMGHGVVALGEVGAVDRGRAIHNLEPTQGSALGKTEGETVDQDVERGEAAGGVPGTAIACSRSQDKGTVISSRWG